MIVFVYYPGDFICFSSLLTPPYAHSIKEGNSKQKEIASTI
ncbi:hypothetical protein FLA_3572 [Filimonas lacunae]|nr:hypothetical protein FLA_3572 [Filimonas lacunae]